MQPCWISALISLKLCVFITDPKLVKNIYGSVCHNIEVGKCHAILIYSDRTNLRLQRFFYSRRPKTHTHTHTHTHTQKAWLDTSDIASDPGHILSLLLPTLHWFPDSCLPTHTHYPLPNTQDASHRMQKYRKLPWYFIISVWENTHSQPLLILV